MFCRQMKNKDLNDVINVIDTHDEDDAEDALRDFENNGINFQWVITNNDKIIGTSGFRPILETDNSAYISWTYIDKKYCKQGFGNQIFEFILNELNKVKVNKIFIKISNYEDKKGNSPYQAAIKLYEKHGFELEIISKDFYDKYEDQLIYSKDLRSNLDENILKKEEKPTIRFVDIFEIAETEGSYSFEWKVVNKPLFQKRSFTAEDLLIGIEAVKERKGRKVFITFPSNLPLIHSPLQEAGFKYIGELKNYYELGIHEMHFVHDLG